MRRKDLHWSYRGDVIQYKRRVPKDVSHLDARGVIRLTLRTTDEIGATIQARAIDASLDKLWSELLAGANAEKAWEAHHSEVETARTLRYFIRAASTNQKVRAG